jgi:L-gulonolactone oxidase
LKYPILSQLIVGAQLVTSDGQLLHVSADTDPDLMAAVRIHLGALGILTQVTIQCTPAFNLHLHAQPRPFEEVLRNMDTLIATNDRVRMYWFAHTDVIYVMNMNPTSEPALVDNPVMRWFEDVGLQRYMLGSLIDIGYHLRGLDLVDEINQFVARVGWDERNQVSRSDRLLNIPMPPKHNECEYAVPVARAAEALQKTRALIMEKKLNANMPVEVRFVAADNIWLSPEYGRDVCYIGAYTQGDSFEQAYFDAFEPLMKECEGRPHWGKHFTMTAEEARNIFPGLDRFNAIRKRLDPSGMFANKLIRDLFG